MNCNIARAKKKKKSLRHDYLKQRIEKTKGTTVGAVSSALITIKMDFWKRIQLPSGRKFQGCRDDSRSKCS